MKQKRTRTKVKTAVNAEHEPAASAPAQPDPLEFCAGLRARRKEAGLTLDELAARAGITPNYIGTIEMGRRDPSLSCIAALATGYGVPPGELFGSQKELSPRGMEVARIFSEAPESLQAGILMVLRALPRR